VCAYQGCEVILIDDTYAVTKEEPAMASSATEIAARKAAMQQNKTAFMLLSYQHIQQHLEQSKILNR
jgi:hypothetical protein